jgi:hypothetical protein
MHTVTSHTYAAADVASTMDESPDKAPILEFLVHTPNHELRGISNALSIAILLCSHVEGFVPVHLLLPVLVFPLGHFCVPLVPES